MRAVMMLLHHLTTSVSKMAREGMLQELDHSKLPVIKELDPDWLNKPYDKGNKYSLPQLLGAPGIAFNTNTYKGSDFTSWGDFWKPEYANKIQLLDDAREVFNIALLKLVKIQTPKILQLSSKLMKSY